MFRWLLLVPPTAAMILGSPQLKTDPPLGYFADHCQRCHGEAGANYSPDLGKGKTDAWLIQEVTEMAEGPGQSPLQGDALNVQVAFHRSLIRKEPFVYVAKLAGGAIAGETTPGAKITVLVGSKRYPAKVTDTEWTATIPKDVQPKTTTVEATQGPKTVKLALAKGWYSHREPLK